MCCSPWVCKELNMIVTELNTASEHMTHKLENQRSSGITNLTTVLSHCESSGATRNFPTWGSCRGAKNPQRIYLWRPVGFDYRTSTGLGEKILGEHRQNLVHTRTQEKGAVTSQETDPDFPVSVQESLAEAWVGGGLLQGWGHCMPQCVPGTFWRRSPFFFITSTIGWSQVKQ